MRLRIFVVAIALCTIANTIDNARTRRELATRLDGIYLILWDQDEEIMELREELYNVNKRIY